MLHLSGRLFLSVFTAQLLNLASCSHSKGRNFQKVSFCGGIFNSSTMQLTSPEWPEKYPVGIQCEYEVKPFSPQVCALQVEFLDFHLPEGGSTCSSDSLIIADHKFCGVVTGSTSIQFQKSSVIIHFRSLYGGGHGFNILIRQNECFAQQQSQDETCGDTFYGSKVELLSPGYPNVYSNNIDCNYTIKKVNKNICQFVITFFDSILEESENCSKDKLMIEEEVLCGNLSSSRRYSVESDLQIRFITDATNSSKGFRIVVEQVKCTDKNRDIRRTYELTSYAPQILPHLQFLQPQDNPPSQYYCCGRAYSEKHFLLVSPGFPINQPSDCLYKITKNNPSTYQLRLQFIFFWISEQNRDNLNCDNEFLEIDGKQFCGCKTGLVFTSTFQEVWETTKIIRLKTNYKSNRPFSGFVLEVFQDDDNTLLRQNKKNNMQQYRFTAESLDSNLNGKGFQSPFLTISKRNFQNYVNQDSLYVWDPVKQFWTISQNILCLRWRVSDWIILIQELLWSQYQCPANSNNNEFTTAIYSYFP